MVCNRCIRVVREEFEKIGLQICHIELGKVELEQTNIHISPDKIRKLLFDNGFELIEDKKSKLIESLKRLIIAQIHKDIEAQPINVNYSTYLSEQLAVDYHYLSTLFSSVENITIEQYIIIQKIERAKELLKYNEDTLTEIAYKLGYSSVAHLSNQFKNITGMTATQFRNMASNFRRPIDELK
jgi:AraC-like DNA-binding protein